ncbi:unannotated protein [freshwater metagenome]|uniref:Unannotated protein n=1 Tax=freshwater metagenome TaxID=449393 RepID=A0A6J7FBD9_9ZZZZ|nr:CHAD domain-containing protein [Actinomycetota bacterium]
MTIEREAKFTVSPSFEMPPFDRTTKQFRCRPPRHEVLDARYFDTDDLSLARAGITLRYRTGDPVDTADAAVAADPAVAAVAAVVADPGGAPGTGGVWTVKLPIARSVDTLIRQEVTFSGPATHVPTAAADLVRVHARSRPLRQVSRLLTNRRINDVVDDADAVVAQIVDDQVAVRSGRTVTDRFREIEIEIHLGGKRGDALLKSLAAQLVDAGAGHDPARPKLLRALGERATAPADVQPEPIGRESDAGSPRADASKFVQRTLATGVTALLANDPWVRLTDEPEPVHALRVATRRLRSDLRTFSQLLDPNWTTSLRTELAWLGSSLGVVRELDVLDERLQDQRAQLPTGDQICVDELLHELARQRVAARDAMLSDMRSRRYDDLIVMLVAAAGSPVFLAAAHKHLARRARDVGLEFVRNTWHSLADAVRTANQARDAGTDETALHDIRIRVKRCRYATEAVVPLVARPAVRFAAGLAALQRTLGDHHDAVAAEEWLRRTASTMPSLAVCCGELITLQRVERSTIDQEWPMLWDAISEKRSRAWMHRK